MAEIFSAFGIDAKLIIIQIFNFGLLLVALWYFLYTPVLRLLEDRQEKIEKGVKDAESAEESLREAEKEKDAIIAKAHHESEDIIKRAEKNAEDNKETILQEAEDKAEHIVKGAEKEAEENTARIKSDAEREIAETAVLAAERIMLEKRNS